MRVVSGKYRGRRIDPPKNFPSRATTDLAKESLFNILQNQYEWEGKEVLDLFAGTGSVSLEFISRGVQSVLSVEKHPIAVRHLNKESAALSEEHWMVLRKDVFRFLDENSKSYPIIFADPPFDLPNLAKLPDLILEGNHLEEEGVFILEHSKNNSFKEHPRLVDERRYGGVYFSFFS